MGKRATLLAAVLMSGCGQVQLVGFACENSGNCEPAPPEPLPPCSAEFRTLPLPEIARDEEICWIFDLAELDDVDEQLYLTGVSMMDLPEGQRYLTDLSRLRHHVNVLLVDGEQFNSEAFPEGQTECPPFFNRGAWPLPLAGSLDQLGSWSFPYAFPFSPSQRLLINQHVVNDLAEPVEVGLAVRLECSRERPERVSGSLAYIANTASPAKLPAATQLEVKASCSAGQTLDLFRLFRRTHLIDTFEVGVSQSGDDDYRLLWSPGGDTPCMPVDENPGRCEFAEPYRVPKDAVLHWTCVYRNRTNLTVTFDGLTDACALFGNYAASDEGTEVESCVR